MLRRPLAALLALGPIALVLGSCRGATQIRVELSTDLDCAAVGDTEVRTQAGAAGIGASSPSAVANGCEQPDGTIGSVVLRPSGANDGKLTLSATLLVKGGVCTDADRSGCIEARRILSYVPGTTLRLPIRLRAACRGVSCTNPEDTCVQGTCRPATVDSTLCAREQGCDEDTVGAPTGDGGSALDAGGDATDGSSRVDATLACMQPYPTAVPPTYYWPFDEATGTITKEQQGMTPATVDGSAWRMGTCGAALATDTQTTLIAMSLPADLYVALWLLVPASPMGNTPILSTLDSGTQGWELQVGPGPSLVVLSCAGPGMCDMSQTKTTIAGWHRVYLERTALGGAALSIDGNKIIPMAGMYAALAGGPLRVGNTPNGIVDELYVYSVKP